MSEIHYVTGNAGKFAMAQAQCGALGITVHQVAWPITEIQAPSIPQVSLAKARSAFEMVGKPVIVDDSGFIIPALNGFPGVNTNLVLKQIGPEGFVRLMAGMEDEQRKASFLNVVTYFDGKTEEQFIRSPFQGRIDTKLTPITNENSWGDLWKIFVPDGYERTLGTFSEQDMQDYYEKNNVRPIYEPFAKWYAKRAPK